MLLYYIDDSFFRPTAFARLMRARLESWMERDRPQLVVVSVSVRCDQRPWRRYVAQRWQIPVLASSGVFELAAVGGWDLRCDSLLLEAASAHALLFRQLHPRRSAQRAG